MQGQNFRTNYLVLLYSLFALLLAGKVNAASLPDFTPLVKKNAAAVVNISTTLKKGRQSHRGFDMPEIPEDSPFHDFFKKFFGQIPEGPDAFPERNSLGSGFIISNDGYVITNNHVVKDADEVIVRLNDKREFIAEVIGSDERSDIAVLKIEGEDLPSLKLGDSSKLEVGEWVLAIGSPFGFDHSVTAGIVSAMGRSLPNENYVPFIQTDVAINPGNSGGPLFNLKGEVIGVNSQIYSRTGGFMGLSFAVPINVVNNVYQQLKEKGRVSRGWLGVLIQDVTRELAESFGMKKPYGALVAKVLPDSPASRAGVEVGDVIVSFDGNEVSSSSDLPPMVGGTNINSQVPLGIIRRGKKTSLKVKIAELPEEAQIAGRSDSSPDQSKIESNPFKVLVKDLTKEQRSELDVGENGVIVEKVSVGPASKAGIRQGDLVLLINNVKVKNAEHFYQLLDELPVNKSVPVLIQRRGGPIFLAIKLNDDS